MAVLTNHVGAAALGCPRQGVTLQSLPTPYNRAHHRFAVFTAGVTFCLLIAGALVTSNDAGLSVPDWPTSFGSIYKIPHMVGGVRFEHTHRMIAEFVGLLTIILAIWTWRVDKRRWIKALAVGALGTVVAQGVLGGLTVLFYLPPAISSAHAALAQTFFCIAVAIAVFTGRRWVEEVPEVELDSRRPSLITLSLLSIFVLYVQLILGAMFRHHGMSWWPHVVNALVVALVLTWTAVRALALYAKIEAVRQPAIALLALLITQLCLGFVAFLTRVAWGRDAVQPELPMVISTVAHVAVGALLLATAVVLAIQVWRHVPVSFAQRVPEGGRRIVAA
ncbi:MAG TPA: COX15/CtaA family protein [Terriglobales bacterium]|nr:COX15/CtaA family protein [Terriglobales bacterium]